MNISFCDLLLILLVFVLSRVVAAPWVIALESSYFSISGRERTETSALLLYAITITVLVIVIFFIIDKFDYYPLQGGVCDFLHKQ